MDAFVTHCSLSPAFVILDTSWVLMSKTSTVCMYVCKNCGLENIDETIPCKHCSFNIRKIRI